MSQHWWLFLSVGSFEFWHPAWWDPMSSARPWPLVWCRTEVSGDFLSANLGPICGDLGHRASRRLWGVQLGVGCRGGAARHWKRQRRSNRSGAMTSKSGGSLATAQKCPKDVQYEPPSDDSCFMIRFNSINSGRATLQCGSPVWH